MSRPKYLKAARHEAQMKENNPPLYKWWQEYQMRRFMVSLYPGHEFGKN
jgi:hypothetical protein